MKTSAFILICAALLVVGEPTYALPRFAARTGAKCQSCHVNPTGGGMRQLFGVQYGREKLPVPAWSQELELEDFTTALTSFLGVGADFRTLYYVRQIPDTGGVGSRSEDSFFQMQGDLYLNFRIAKKVSLYLKKGLYSGFEVFGLFQLLPAQGHLKVGKFIPNFGLKLDDHTTFIRTYTGFSPALGRPELTGLEAGVMPGPMSFYAGIYNAADAFGGAGGSQKALLGRAEGMFSLGDNANLWLGANIFAREETPGTKHTFYGGFGAISYKDFTLFGEADLLRTKTQATVTGVVLYAEADYMVTPGLDLKVAYDFYDPDKDFKSGSLARYSFGFEFFPLPGVEVRPMYRILKENPTELRNNELHLLLHIYL